MQKIPKSTLIARPPIVVVLGHVDHGKTTLLDVIRQTSVAAKEVGGITQKVGASIVTTKGGKKITFIDTPGHAAFFGMRQRGSKVADLAVLVVAADAGIQVQTKEALEHIQKVNLPFIVALTKVDLPSADSQQVLSQLEKEGLLLEKRGGNVPWVEVSAKDGRGIEELLEVITLLAEVQEIKADSQGLLEAVVLETQKSKGGCMVNIVVRNGKLTVGGTIYTSGVSCKIKNLIGQEGIKKEALPGEVVQVLGFSSPPAVGEAVFEQPMEVVVPTIEISRRIKVAADEIGIILKAANAGALEAVTVNLPDKVIVINSGVGDVFESDVLQAKASGACIIVFEAKTASQVKKLAEAEGVEIHSFKIIYELFDFLKKILKKGEVEILGKAEIIADFPFNKKRIAGCKLIVGKIRKTDCLILERGGRELAKIKAVSLKKQKQEVIEVGPGEEFGLLFTPQLDFTMGDVILAINNQ